MSVKKMKAKRLLLEKQKLRKCVASRPIIRDMLRLVLQAEKMLPDGNLDP